MTKRAFEDFTVGEVLVTGARTITRAEIIAFASEFDPQPFHLDEGDRNELLGGLVASGWHSGVIFMRLICDAWLNDVRSLGSPGIETLKWRMPLHPGDTVTVRSTVLTTRPSNSRPELGFVRFRHELINQAGETIMWAENPMMIGRRGAADGV